MAGDSNQQCFANVVQQSGAFFSSGEFKLGYDTSPPQYNNCFSFASLFNKAIRFLPSKPQIPNAPTPVARVALPPGFSGTGITCPAESVASSQGLSYCGTFLEGTLTVSASAIMKGGFFVEASLPSKSVSIGMKGAGLHFKLDATFKLSGEKRYAPTKTFTLTNGKSICADPSGASCLPALLTTQTFMAGDIPIVMVVTAQLFAEVTFTAAISGGVDATMHVDETFSFNLLKVGFDSNGFFSVPSKDRNGAFQGPNWNANTPAATKIVLNAKGEVSAKLKIYPKISMMVNGIPFVMKPFASLELKGTITANGEAETANSQPRGRRLLGTGTASGCLVGKISLIVDGGVTVGIENLQVAEMVTAGCQATTKLMCDGDGPKLLNCITQAAINHDPCKDIGGLCTQVTSLIQKNTANGEMPASVSTPSIAQTFDFWHGAYPEGCDN